MSKSIEELAEKFANPSGDPESAKSFNVMNRRVGFIAGAAAQRELLKDLGKECYNEAYFFETEYPSTPWSKLLFRVAKAIEGDKNAD